MLIGGHTLEDRNPAPDPCSLGLQLVLSVQGSPQLHSLLAQARTPSWRSVVA